MRQRWWMVAVALLLSVGACSGDASDDRTTTSGASNEEAASTTTSIVPPLAEDPEPPEPTIDRLVMISLDGEVVSMDRRGGNTILHSQPGEIPMQPIWDPAGERISYSLLGPQTALVVAAADGSERNVTELETNPFYLHWSHDGDRLASLRNSPTGLAFEIFDVSAATPTVEFTDAGAPYYFDWSPTGADLVAHVGVDRLDLWSGVEYEPAGLQPGFFSAPQWLETGVLAPISVEGEQQIALISADGSLDQVVQFEGSALFELEASIGRLLAAQALTDATDAISASFQIDRPLPQNEFVVVNLDTGAIDTVNDAPVISFFWSPFGERLLFLTTTDQPGILQWSVWDDGTVVPGPEFSPFRNWLAEFIPFFEQYARSMTMWAPDGSAYAFPGQVGDERGVWVVDIATGELELIGEGIWVAWSHT